MVDIKAGLGWRGCLRGKMYLARGLTPIEEKMQVDDKN